jgi:hypothetical protein
MSDIRHEFRKHAERCRLGSETAVNRADRAFWLLLAEGWQKLAQDYETDRGKSEPARQPSPDEQLEPADQDDNELSYATRETVGGGE